MNINDFREKLRRYAEGTASDAERAVIEAWYRSYKNEESAAMDAGKAEAIKKTISKNIYQRTAVRSIKPAFYYRIAASILLTIGIGWLGYSFFSKSKKEVFTYVQTGPGQLKQVVLPDSSVMWVNAMTRIRVSEDFNGDLRKVYIDNGEAFFKVKHDKERPFRVYVSGLQVQVLGTSFNINAYKGLPEVKVGVATGKVAVSYNNKNLAMLTPGKELAFNRQNHAHQQHNVDMAHSLSWRDGRTYLNQASFAELAVVVKSLYNISLKPANQTVNHYQFTLQLQRSMQPDEVLKTISMIHNTHFRKEGDEVVLY